jgi:hypothetical protein
MLGRAIRWTAVIVAVIGAAGVRPAGAAAVAPPLSPPAIVLEHLDALRSVDRVKLLPAAIQTGDFERPGPSGPWILAEPRAPWNATDVPLDSSLPYRRLILGACDATLCIVHYERGGRGWSAHVLAVALVNGGWKAVWHAVGFATFGDVTELRALVRNTGESRYSDSVNWSY